MKSSAPVRTRERATEQNSRIVSETGSSGATLSLVAFVGMIALAAIFVAHRQADIGKLPVLLSSFITALIHEKVFSLTGVAQSLAGAGVALLIVMSWHGAGDLIVALGKRLFAKSATTETGITSPALEVARRCAFGAGMWSLLWFVLGLYRLYRGTVAMIALIAGLALFARSFARALKTWRQVGADEIETKTKTDWLWRVALTITLLSMLLALIAALAPPTGKDALIYHLALPKAFLAAGGLTETPGNIAGYYALGVEMNGVWALLLGGLFSSRIAEAAFGATIFAFYPLLIATVYGWAREAQLGRAESMIAAAMMATIPTAWLSASSGYTDLALTLYLTLVIQAAARWRRTAEPLNLVWITLALGCALTIKLIAVFSVFPLTLLFLLKARQAQNGNTETQSSTLNVRRTLWQGLLTLVCAGTLGSQWYLRNWICSGSPIFPFYLSLWPGSAPGWDAERSQMLGMFLSGYGAKGLLGYVAAPFYLSLTAQPELSGYYDGVLGISFLPGLALLLFALRRAEFNSELRIAGFFSAALFVCWLFTSQQMRFLLPALSGLAVATVAAASTLMKSALRKKRGGLTQWTLLLSTLAGLLVSAAWFLEKNPVRAVLGGEMRKDYLTRQLDYYPYYEIINLQLPADARVWLINMRRDTYHLERPYFSDYLFEDYTLTKYVRESASVQQLRARTRAMGVTHLLVRHGVLLDYANSPIVDERKTEAENQQKMQLLKSFLTAGTKIMRSDGKFMLIELPSA